jgi:hypothetical protein
MFDDRAKKARSRRAESVGGELRTACERRTVSVRASAAQEVQLLAAQRTLFVAAGCLGGWYM